MEEKKVLRSETEKVLRAEIAKTERYYEIIMEVLDAVKRVYKKSGGDFENIKNNFTLEGDAVKKYEITFDWEKSVWDTRTFDYLKINYTANDEGTRDTLFFNIYECLDERDAKYEEMKKNGRLVEGGVGLKDFYNLTADEIMKLIKEERGRAERRLNVLESRADEVVEKGLEVWEHIQAILEIKDELLEDSGRFESVCYRPMRTALEREFDRLRF